jgi:TPR repeat protein
MKLDRTALVLACVFFCLPLIYAQDLTALHTKAAKGDMKAQATLGIKYSKNGNHVEAVKWLRLAAEQGEVWGQYELSLHYGNGEGVEKDVKEAFQWCLKAAEQGFKFAQNSIGVCYAQGMGVSKDTSLAAKWFQKAAEQGVDTAQLKLALLYAEGNGVTLDYVQAFKWISLAAEQGNELAKHFTKEWESQLTAEQRTQALRLVRDARLSSERPSNELLNQSLPALENSDRSIFQTLSLKHGIAVKIPRHWQILKSQLTKQLDTNTEVLTGEAQGDNDILLAANFYDGTSKDASASARVSVRTKQSFSQRAVEDMSETDLALMSEQGYQSALTALKNGDYKDVQITPYKTTKVPLSGYIALRTDGGAIFIL